jgi:hypothetical protein
MSHAKPLAGGGSGGGPEAGQHEETHEGTYSVSASQISLLANPSVSPLLPGEPVISILAAATLGLPVGRVDVRAGQGVRLAAGPAPPAGPPGSDGSTSGVEVATGALESIKLERGLLPTDQKIEMTPTGIRINAGSMPVEIESLTGITLSVAGGVAKIHIGPEGVSIEGLTLRLSASILAEIKGTMTTVQATAINKVSGAVTMIGP